MSDEVSHPKLTPAGFPMHSSDSAPPELRERLEKHERSSSGLANYLALFAGSPVLFDAFEAMSRRFAASRLSVTEKQIIMLTASLVNNCEYCMAAHSFSARRQGIDGGIIAALRRGAALADPKLESLRRFTHELVLGRGSMSDETLAQFLSAGYTHEQALEVVLATAIKTVTSYADKLARLPLDETYQPEAWSAEDAKR